MTVNINQIFKGLGDKYVKPRIECNDGFSMSVQASETHYCEPRETDAQSYWMFEVGYPSSPEEALFPYADDRDDPVNSAVFGYVPANVIEAIIEKHGGVK